MYESKTPVAEFVASQAVVPFRGGVGRSLARASRGEKLARHAAAGAALAYGARRIYDVARKATSSLSGLGTGAKPAGTKVYKTKR